MSKKIMPWKIWIAIQFAPEQHEKEKADNIFVDRFEWVPDSVANIS